MIDGTASASRARCVVCRDFLCDGDEAKDIVEMPALGAIGPGFAHPDCAALVSDLYYPP